MSIKLLIALLQKLANEFPTAIVDMDRSDGFTAVQGVRIAADSDGVVTVTIR